MTYECIPCDYVTNDKSNYNKHLKCKSHLKKHNSSNNNKSICKFCDKIFSTHSNLLKHESRCMNKVLKIKELELELKYANKQIEILKNNIDTDKKNTTVYNVSIKKFIQQQYSDAPPLEGLENYAALKFEEEYESEDTMEDEFVSMISYNHIQNCLHKYLGDFIIKYYKKDDPKQQSVWSSDVSRLTYIIKEILDNKKSIWNHDYKGVKTKGYIINPLLQYLKQILNDYWIANIDNFKNIDTDYVNKLFKIFKSIHEIKKEIDNGHLADSIIKYIAPHFYMNKDPDCPSLEFNNSCGCD